MSVDPEPDRPAPSSAEQGAAIRVTVRLFAMHRELAGVRQAILSLPRGARVEDGWNALVTSFPALEPGRASVRFAVNGDYAEPTAHLVDGDELACIPPVSGGSDEEAGALRSGRVIELHDRPFPPALGDALAERLATPEDGAVVIFAGRTRISPGTPAPGQEAEAARHAGREVTALEYEAHDTMAVAQLERIADEIAVRFAVTRLAILHRTGIVPLGETSILVVAVAPHRDAAFAAARYAIDETKARVPIWKAESFADGHVWMGAPARTGPVEPPTPTSPLEPPTKPGPLEPPA